MKARVLFTLEILLNIFKALSEKEHSPLIVHFQIMSTYLPFMLFIISGFTYVKELTLEVQNVIAPPKPRSAFREKVTLFDNSTTVKSPSKADDKSELPSSGERVPENDRPDADNSEQTARSPPDSPAGSNTVVSPSKGFQDMRTTKDISVNGSPHAFDTQR